MSWFGFLFGKKKFEKDSEPIERAPRVQLNPLHNVEFYGEEPSTNGKGIAVYNLSVTGVGFISDSFENWPQEGDRIKGYFQFPGYTAPVSIQMIRTDSKIIGGSFVGEPSKLAELRKIIAKYFALELSALNMSEVNSELLRVEPDGKPYLFRGEENCELFFVEDHEGIVRFRLTFFGNCIEGSTDRTMEFGHYCGEEDSRKFGTDLIMPMATLPPEIVDYAIKFVENIQGLKSERSEEICNLIRQQAS